MVLSKSLTHHLLQVMKIELDSKNIRVNENKEDLLEDSPRTPEECKARMEEVNEAIKLVSWISSCFSL